MKVEVDEAIKCMELLEALTQPTIHYLNVLKKQTETEFIVELREGPIGAGGPLVKPVRACITEPRPGDCQRLAAASILLARFLGYVGETPNR
ncbi:MAG TPA: hypothetical protein VF958_10675 [Thermoanaerobaculia bacterium]